MNAIEGFFKIDVVDIERRVPFKGLLHYGTQHKDLVCTAPATSETCLFLSQCPFNGLPHSLQETSTEDLSRH